MKYVAISISVIVLTLILTVLINSRLPVSSQERRGVNTGLSDGWIHEHVDKFKDGDVTCYLYTINYGGGISCIK